MTDLRLSIAQSLTSITSLYRDLEAEALHRYADKDYPGGDALLMLGPVANLEAWNYQQLSDMMGRTDHYRGCDDLDSDPAPPLLVLAGWADVVAAERGDDRRQRATVEHEAEYLRDTLDWITGVNADGAPYFIVADEMSRDLRHLVSRLEAVLHDGIAVDRGVPCMRCLTNLEKVWGADEDSDRWVCRRCNEWSSIDQYNQALRADYLRNAKALTAPDMEAEYRVKAGTLRVWANRGDIRKRGVDQYGRLLYDVADTLAKRDANDASIVV